MRHILWIDDEIQTLRSHVLFLEARGYKVTPASNGEDGLSLLAEQSFDAILLDHRMAGMDGLTVLEAIKGAHPHIPVIMITQSGEEALIEDALRNRVDDFLIKPVQAVQVTGTLKRVMDQPKMVETAMPGQYVEDYQAILDLKGRQPGWLQWMDIYCRLVRWDMRLSEHEVGDLPMLHQELRSECNRLFSDYVVQHYAQWMCGEDSPPLSVDVMNQCVFPHIEQGEQVYFVVIDCLRLDQWYTLAPILSEFFDIEEQLYYGILPSATGYARNALFSGLFPKDIAARYPQYWVEASEEDTSANRFEKQLLELKLERAGLYLKPPPRYFKIFDAEGGEEYRKRVASFDRVSLATLVVNFLDVLTHERSQSEVLQQIAPDEKAFRELMVSWFRNSDLLEIFKILATKKAVVVLTTDHGSILCNRASKVFGNRHTTTSLRFKMGERLGCDAEEAYALTNPELFNLPADMPGKTYLFAKEDFYFVYPTDFHVYRRQLKGGFQHGGISMEELILPVITMRAR